MQFHFLVSRYYVSNLFVVDADLYSQSFGIQETFNTLRKQLRSNLVLLLQIAQGDEIENSYKRQKHVSKNWVCIFRNCSTITHSFQLFQSQSLFFGYLENFPRLNKFFSRNKRHKRSNSIQQLSPIYQINASFATI